MPLNSIVRSDRYVPDASVEERNASAHAAIMQILQMNGLIEKHQREFLTIALWKWTEASGIAPHEKYNVRFCSAGTRAAEPAKVNHEHVWPRKGMIDKLLTEHQASDAATVRAFLEAHGIACIVTVEEHALLGSSAGNGWARYVNAGVEVWDRQEERPLVINPDIEPADQDAAAEDAEPVDSTEEDAVAVPPGMTPSEAFGHFAAARADLLRRLVRTLQFADCVAIVGSTRRKDREVGDYVRIHDARIEEPTPAMAFVHWTGKVSVRAQLTDLPAELAQLDCVKPQTHARYGVKCQVDDEASMEAAEELVMVAVSKYRDAFEAGDV